MEVEVRSGCRRDAVLFGVGANQDHGLQRTNADKRKAFEILLGDEEWQAWSDREIARRVGVGHPLVASVRAEFSLESDSSETRSVTYTTKHGTVATMKARAPAHDPDEVTCYPGTTTVAQHIPVPTSGSVITLQPAAAVQLDPAPTPGLDPEPSPTAELTLQQRYDDLLERSQELARMLEETVVDNERMSAVIDADDHLKAAMARIKQLEALVEVMEVRAGGLMAEKNEAIKAAKRWQRKAEGR
jgi:hypothetical protein